ncbi:MAG: Gfo/Idh/MocA family oxidoreductase [Verrucomicrobia bacterium]|nr:Gfo/Idh/MocA family oxidoreductase [Verrucomicrobiota bacterium]
MKKEDSVKETKPLNFAVIGCGMLARSQHIPNIAKSEKTALHTCCDLSDEALAECRDKHGALHISKDYKSVIHDPEVDAICIATTEKMRLPLIREAALAGKPVYCEKPLARTLEEMFEIQSIVNEAKIPFCVGHNRRSSPAMLDAHRIFRSHMENPKPCAWRFDREGDERPPRADDGTAAMSVRINDDWYSWKSWVFDKEQAPHGPMLFEMTHFTDLCNWFLDSEPVEVMAMEQGMLNHGILVRYKNGEIATLLMCANGTFGYPKELYEMFGNGGAVVVDHMLEVRTVGIEGAPARKIYPMLNDLHPQIGTEGGLFGWLAKKAAACQETVETADQMKQFTAEPNKGHAHAIDRFVDEIQGNGPVVCSVDDAVRATLVAFAAIRSAKEGRAVKLAELR